MIWIIPLAIVAIACSATMDEIRFHWYRIFAYWFSANNKMYRWFNPSISWMNKYEISNNQYIQWLFKSPLVFMLNCLYGIITILAKDLGVEYHWLWMILGFNFGWGAIYEFTSGVFGVLSDRKKFN